ncbi:hypothetical protein LSH36_453g02045 [Paralvinella palmiformis]|uniref:Uncharacterized protein n=1 Tax=Paralvinella palmiformis TaxID=53620 RepID=A0AAD9JA49_9ANNE|nr:hypothetical protein LSH36_453g02045 [Paralvinella palmiformis]
MVTMASVITPRESPELANLHSGFRSAEACHSAVSMRKTIRTVINVFMVAQPLNEKLEAEMPGLKLQDECRFNSLHTKLNRNDTA